MKFGLLSFLLLGSISLNFASSNLESPERSLSSVETQKIMTFEENIKRNEVLIQKQRLILEEQKSQISRLLQRT